MSQITLTNEERRSALARLGYSEQEAHFLCLAALHGGYFLRRQYAEFLSGQDGGTVTQLIGKVLVKGHAEVATYRANTHLYHLSARPFYAALGQEDNRNRRRKELVTVKTKLMGFDFVLAHLEHEYLATEREKIDFFQKAIGAAQPDLPAKRYACNGQLIDRFFVEKYPLFLRPAAQTARPPAATFCFVDPGQASVLGFETFLNRYARLFARLPEFAVTYVAASDRLFEKARLLFDQFWHDSVKVSYGTGARANQQMLEYFEARHLYDSKQLGSFDRDKLIRLRDYRETFSGPEIDALYERWKAGATGAAIHIAAPKNGAFARTSGHFSTYLLEHSYDLFGSLTAY